MEIRYRSTIKAILDHRPKFGIYLLRQHWNIYHEKN